MLEEAAQTLVADGVGETQIERRSHDARAEGRPLVHPVGNQRQGGGAAAGAMPGITLHPCDDRADRRQFDLVVPGMEAMIAIAQRRAAMPAGRRLGGHDLIGLLRQQAATALAAQATLTGAALLLAGPVRLRCFGRRHAGIVRCLRRLVQLRLQHRNPLHQRGDLSPQSDDQSVLLRMGQRRQIGKRRKNHSKVESRLDRPVNPTRHSSRYAQNPTPHRAG